MLAHIENLDRLGLKGAQPIADLWTRVTGTSNFALACLLSGGVLAAVTTSIYQIPALGSKIGIVVFGTIQLFLLSFLFLAYVAEDFKWRCGNNTTGLYRLREPMPWGVIRVFYLFLTTVMVGSMIQYVVWGTLLGSGMRPVYSFWVYLVTTLSMYIGACSPAPPEQPA